MATNKWNSWWKPDAKYSNYNSDLDSYMSQLYGQYGSTPWWSEFQSNPYLSLGEEPHNFWWNAPYYDQLRRDRYDAAMAHINQILGKIREQGYNEPVEQVQRERTAGINSDLNGSVGANQATEGTELPLPGMPSKVDSMSGVAGIVTSIGDGLLGVLQTAVGFAGDIESLNGQKITNRISAVGYQDALDKLVFDRLVKTMGVPNFKDGMSPDDFEAEFGNQIISASEKMDWSGIPRNIRKDYQRLFNSYKKDAKTNRRTLGFQSELYKRLSAYMNDRENVASKVGKPYYSDDDLKFYEQYGKMVGDLEYKTWMSLQGLEQIRNELQASLAYIGNESVKPLIQDGDPFIGNETDRLRKQQQAATSQASASTAESDTKELREKLNKEVEKAVKEISDEFDSLVSWIKKSDSFFAPIALTLVPLLKAQAISKVRGLVYDQSPLKNPFSPPLSSGDSGTDLGNAIKMLGF